MKRISFDATYHIPNRHCDPDKVGRSNPPLLIILFVLILVFGHRPAFAQWTTSGSNVYYNGGNVGIGTSSPAYKLSLNSTSQNMLSVKSSSHSIIDIESGLGLNSYLRFVNNGINKWDIAGETGGNLRVYDYLSGVIRMVITPSGNVGIGVSNPTYKLQVAGGGFFQQRLVVQGDIANDNNAAFWNYSTTGYGLYSQGGGGSKYSFHFLNREGGSILYGKGDGQIGIGTTNPDSKLTVKGTVHAEEVKVDLSVPGPDYVFEEDYALQSLEEIESYVKVNKHLPDVPSAVEMEAEGIKVGEMNMLLLKKIEEMTLHLIDQSKQLRDMNQLIINQQSEIEKLKSEMK